MQQDVHTTLQTGTDTDRHTRATRTPERGGERDECKQSQASS